MTGTAGPGELSGLHIIVLGAGGGLGHATALELAARGAELSLWGRSRHRLEVTATATGTEAEHVRLLDVTDLQAVHSVFAEAPVPDAVVNTTGTNVPEPVTTVRPDTFDAIFAVNVRAAYFVLQAAAKRMLAAGRTGSLVTVSSQMGHVGAPDRSVYCASKHAVEGMTKALAVELAPSGIRVNTVAPTFVRTAMTEPFLAEPAAAASVLGRIPLGRFGTAEEIAAAAAFLVSPASALITGTSLLLDGGWTAQ